MSKLLSSSCAEEERRSSYIDNRNRVKSKIGSYTFGITISQEKTRNETLKRLPSIWIKANLSEKVAEVLRCLIHLLGCCFASVYFSAQL